MADFEVVCPVRNGGPHFAKTLRSLRDQGGAGCALLISDNFSTDGNPWRETLPELAGWEVRVVQPPSELGRVEHWNWACQRSTAQVLKLMMSGDLAEPGALGEMRAALAEHPETTLAFGQNRVRETGKEYVAGGLPAGGAVSRAEYLALSLRRFNFIGTLSGVAFRGDTLRAALPFEAAHPWTADWRLYTRCLNLGPAWSLHRPVCLLDRTIARFSSSTKVIRGSLREEWVYLRELARLSPGDRAGSFFGRLRIVGFQAVVKYGRALLPRPLRKAMGACYRMVARIK
jgi:hypothetical protein